MAKLKSKLRTNPELFIVESLTLNDEKHARQEGDMISRMLHHAGKRETKFYYIRTSRELRKFIKVFAKSKHRYLHISCHANDVEFDTTFDAVSYEQFGRMLRPHLRGKRVFVSACEMANRSLAGELFRNSGLVSLIGPREAINFDDSAAFWVSSYHLMFKADHYGMKRRTLKKRIYQLSEVYDVKINYFTKYGAAFRLLTQ